MQIEPREPIDGNSDRKQNKGASERLMDQDAATDAPA
jgi:hypothetical protein